MVELERAVIGHWESVEELSLVISHWSLGRDWKSLLLVSKVSKSLGQWSVKKREARKMEAGKLGRWEAAKLGLTIRQVSLNGLF